MGHSLLRGRRNRDKCPKKQTKRRAGKAAGAGDAATEAGDEPAPTQSLRLGVANLITAFSPGLLSPKIWMGRIQLRDSCLETVWGLERCSF